MHIYTYDYIKMEITVLYLKISRHQLSISWSQISVYWLRFRVAVKLNLPPSNLQLMQWNFQIQYSYLLIMIRLLKINQPDSSAKYNMSLRACMARDSQDAKHISFRFESLGNWFSIRACTFPCKSKTKASLTNQKLETNSEIKKKSKLLNNKFTNKMHM